jgi:hypothetical protein
MTQTEIDAEPKRRTFRQPKPGTGFSNRPRIDQNHVLDFFARVGCEKGAANEELRWKLTGTPIIHHRFIGLSPSAHLLVEKEQATQELILDLSSELPALCERALPAKLIAKSKLRVAVIFNVHDVPRERDEDFGGPMERIGRWTIQCAAPEQKIHLKDDERGFDALMARLTEARRLIEAFPEENFATCEGTEPMHVVSGIDLATSNGVKTRAASWTEAVLRTAGTKRIIDALFMGPVKNPTPFKTKSVVVVPDGFDSDEADELAKTILAIA